MMELEEYLDVIENCPDEEVEIADGRKVHRLYSEHGIYDNHSFWIGVDEESFVSSFLDREGFSQVELEPVEEGGRKWFNYDKGTVVMQYRSYGDPGEIEGMLHPYQGGEDKTFPGKRMEGVSDEKALVEVMGLIGKWVLEERIPLVLPQKGGREIVLHDPKGEFGENF